MMMIIVKMLSPNVAACEKLGTFFTSKVATHTKENPTLFLTMKKLLDVFPSQEDFQISFKFYLAAD